MNHADNQKIREAITSCLSGVEAMPSRRGEILRAARGEKKVKRKMSKGLVLALVLMLMMGSVAVAAELGLFGQIGNQVDADVRLPGLDAVSIPVEQSFTTPEGVTVTINQAFYDGTRVFLAYTVAGPHASVELGEGKPDVVNYDWQGPGVIYAREYADESAVGQQMTKWLDGSSDRWAKKTTVYVSDNMEMDDGTKLNIIGGGGDDIYQADGAYINWKECEVPADKAEEEITVKLRVCTSETTWYQTADCLYRNYGGIVERNEIVFTVKRDANTKAVFGSVQGDVYVASAQLSVSAVDIKGEVIIGCPDTWCAYWDQWDFNNPKLDLICNYVLYIGDTPVDGWNIDGAVGTRGMDAVRYGICYQLNGITEDLKLVPVYRLTGEHMDEAIILTVETE